MTSASLLCRRLLLPGIVLIMVLIVCICVGSVMIPVRDVLAVLINAVSGAESANAMYNSIILFVRLPRVLCVACVGAALSLCGAAMQGLLRNPLADGSTLGVASGASLGAVCAIAFGITVPGLPLAGTTVMAALFAIGSLFFILALADRIDHSLSTTSIILIGVIFSMFANSLISLIVTFASDKLHSITLWTMGSLSGAAYEDFWLILVTLIIVSVILLRCTTELDAFAIGETNARHIGVNVRQIKLVVLISVSLLIGVCVSISGTIAFVGLVVPHITRMLCGPGHKVLLPACMLYGAIFLLLADLVSRILLSPIELPIGVVTSFIGAIVFVVIFFRSQNGTV